MEKPLKINENSVYIACYHDEENGETRVELNGELVETAKQNLKDVRVVVAFRDAKNRVVNTAEDWLDDFEEDTLEFSLCETLPTKLLKKVKTIELTAKARLDFRSTKLEFALAKTDSFKQPGGS